MRANENYWVRKRAKIPRPYSSLAEKINPDIHFFSLFFENATNPAAHIPLIPQAIHFGLRYAGITNAPPH